MWVVFSKRFHASPVGKPKNPYLHGQGPRPNLGPRTLIPAHQQVSQKVNEYKEESKKRASTVNFTQPQGGKLLKIKKLNTLNFPKLNNVEKN